jgi:NADH-quinone oxidoreductase subunit M
MDFFRANLLTIVAFWPLAGMVALLFIPKEKTTLIKWWANLVVLSGFVVSLPLWFWFDVAGSDRMQFEVSIPWIQTLGASYHVGIDGISLLLIMLTTLIGPLAVLSSWDAIQVRVKEYYAFMLLLQAGMLGVFISLDFFLFYVFWEVMLVPMYFLIGVWGGPRKLYAAIKFFLYTLVGSVLMLLGILALYFAYPQVAANHPEISNLFGSLPTFNVLALHAIGPYLPENLQWWVFLAFFVGFAIKVPMFPFHTWLPDAHVEAPTAGSVILAAVLLKMGTYGFLRFSIPILPKATVQFVPLMITLAIIAIIYGALVAMMQPDMKKLVAYSSVSHMGFVMLGMFALNPNGLNGSRSTTVCRPGHCSLSWALFTSAVTRAKFHSSAVYRA